MSYWPHSNPEPETVGASTARSNPPCPGVCNRDWRKAERDHRRTELLEAELAALQERAPKVVHCKACLDQVPGHGVDAVAGEPVWCGPCTKRIARALLSLPDFYVQLELDKMHGTRSAERDPNSGHAPKAAAAPSPAPCVDEQDGLARFLSGWEDLVRETFSFSHRPARLPARRIGRASGRRVWLGHPDRPPHVAPPPVRSLAALAASAQSETMMGAVRFLTVHLEAILAHESLARDFGRAVVAEATELRRRTAMHEQRTRKKAPCPRCGLKTLVHEGGEDHIECENPACGRLLDLGEYDDLEVGMARRGTVHSTATGKPA